MIAEINFQLNESQRTAMLEANAAYHRAAPEDNDGYFPTSEVAYEALLKAWEFIGEINQDWIQ